MKTISCSEMMIRMTKEDFISNVTEQIRCVRARDGIARELSDHITDQAAAYEEAGEAHEDAVERAVREMGDPVEVGVELDRIHRPQIDYKLIAMAFLFHIAGAFLLWKVSDVSLNPQNIAKQCVVLLLSFGVMTGMYFLDYSFIARYAYGIFAFATAAMLIGRIFTMMAGRTVSFMLGYLYLPVFVGILYRLRKRGYFAVIWAMGMQVVIAYLTYSLSGLPTAANIYMMCTILLVIAIAKGWFLVRSRTATAAAAGVLLLLPAALVMGSVILFGHGYQSQRLQACLHPEHYAKEAGYIYLWLRQKWETARLIGTADNSMFQSENMIGFYVTEPFILLQLVCHYGILAGVALVAAFAAVAARAFQIARRQKNQLGFMLSAACFMVILINCLEGILINTGYYPVSSMQFPFVTYSACTGMTYAVLIGLLLSIYRNERILTDETLQRPTWRLTVKWEKR